MGGVAVGRSRMARPVMEKRMPRRADGPSLVLTGSDEMVFSTSWTQPSRFARTSAGAALPAYCVANGKAMLAFRKSAGGQGVTRQAPVRHDDHPQRRLWHISTPCRPGYAVNRGDYRPDVSGWPRSATTPTSPWPRSAFPCLRSNDSGIDQRSGAACGGECPGDLVGSWPAPEACGTAGIPTVTGRRPNQAPDRADCGVGAAEARSRVEAPRPVNAGRECYVAEPSDESERRE